MGKIKTKQDVQDAYDTKMDKAAKLASKGRNKRAIAVQEKAEKKYKERNLAFPLAESNHGKDFSNTKSNSYSDYKKYNEENG